MLPLSTPRANCPGTLSVMGDFNEEKHERKPDGTFAAMSTGPTDVGVLDEPSMQDIMDGRDIMTIQTSEHGSDQVPYPIVVMVESDGSLKAEVSASRQISQSLGERPDIFPEGRHQRAAVDRKLVEGFLRVRYAADHVSSSQMSSAQAIAVHYSEPVSPSTSIRNVADSFASRPGLAVYQQDESAGETSAWLAEYIQVHDEDLREAMKRKQHYYRTEWRYEDRAAFTDAFEGRFAARLSRPETAALTSNTSRDRSL